MEMLVLFFIIFKALPILQIVDIVFYSLAFQLETVRISLISIENLVPHLESRIQNKREYDLGILNRIIIILVSLKSLIVLSKFIYTYNFSGEFLKVILIIL